MPRHYHNLGPAAELPDTAPRDAVRVEFARRLSAAMAKKGWNQSELARRASEQLPERANPIGRDLVSVYIRGKSLPSAHILSALATALSVEPADLLPTRGTPSASDNLPKIDVKDVGNGMSWLRVNQQVPWPIALKIMQLLQNEEG